MANKTITINVPFPAAGYSYIPDVGRTNDEGVPIQYGQNVGFDLWSEPGVIMPMKSLEQYLNASLPDFTTASQNILDVTYVGTADNASFSNKIYGVGQDSNNLLRLVRREGANSWASLSSLAVITNLDNGAHIEMQVYQENENPLFIGAGPQGAFQVDANLAGTAWNYTTDTSGYPSFCVEKKDGFFYYGWAQDDSFPELGYVARVDYTTTTSSLANTSYNLREAIKLEVGDIPIDMERIGDFIAIIGCRRGKLSTGDSSYTQQGFVDASTLYIWDGIISTFDRKIPIRGFQAMAVKNVNGRLFLIGTNSSGMVELREWNGGNDLVWRATYRPRPKSQEYSAGRVWILPTAVSNDGDLLIFGTSGTKASNGIIFAYDTKNNVPHMMYGAVDVGERMIRVVNNLILRTELGSNTAVLKETDLLAGPFSSGQGQLASITWPYMTPEPGKLFQIKKVTIRHSSISSLSTLDIGYIRNRENSIDIGTGFQPIVQRTGDGVSGAIGAAGINAVRTYSLDDNAGNFPILDCFAPHIRMTSNSSVRTKIYPPLIFEVEVLDSPQ